MEKKLIVFFAASMFLMGCQPPLTPVDSVYLEELSRWRAERLEELKAPDGWLALAGLYWLKQGENTFGSDPSNQVVFPAKAPGKLGTFFLEGDSVRMAIEPGNGVEEKGQSGEIIRKVLKLEPGVPPAILQWGTLEWVLLERGGRYGIRLWDKEHPGIQALDSIPAYAVDPTWKVEATLLPADSGRTVTMQNVLGMTMEQASAGILQFKKGGKTYQLEALEDPEGFFLIFADATSGEETYSGGRYLYVANAPEEGKIWIDFNKAENPPCAFTKFATCLLPPAQNRLSLAVKAGELTYGKH